MATYQYEAMSAQGQEIKDEIEALSTEEAISKIRNLGFFPTKIREKGARRSGKKAATPTAAAKPKRARGTGGKVKVKTLTQFTRQLSTLQDAGLPILRSLRILEQQQRPGTLKRVCGAVADEKDDNDKPIYSNAEKRKAETQRRLNEDEEYQRIQADLEEKRQARRTNQIQFDGYRRLLRTLNNRQANARSIMYAIGGTK